VRVIVPLSGVHRGSLAALRYARYLSDDVTAVYVSTSPDEAERIQLKWELWAADVPLVILDSPYRILVRPLLHFIEETAAGLEPDEMLTVVVPQFVPRHQLNNFLHTQTAWLLRTALLFTPGVVVTDVPYQVS